MQSLGGGSKKTQQTSFEYGAQRDINLPRTVPLPPPPASQRARSFSLDHRTGKPSHAEGNKKRKKKSLRYCEVDRHPWQSRKLSRFTTSRRELPTSGMIVKVPEYNINHLLSQEASNRARCRVVPIVCNQCVSGLLGLYHTRKTAPS